MSAADVQRATLRMFRLLPVNLPAPGTVADADLRTSMCDARAALTLTLGDTPDVDGYPIPTGPGELALFELAA